MRREGNPWKVGLTVVTAVAVLAVAVLVVGQQSQLFVRKNEYQVRFKTASGINPGSPVELNGVNVGRVKRVVLPTDASDSEIAVTIEIDRAYADRIRQDSVARIKTLGLLGDKFVDLSAGSPGAQPLPPGGVIPTAPMTDVDRLLTSGEDVMDNVVQISASLRTILQRTERGEGLLGDLTMDSASGTRLSDAAVETLNSIQRVAELVEKGDGTLPRLLRDREIGDRLTSTLTRLESLVARAESGDGLLKVLIDDPGARQNLDQALADLATVSRELAAFSKDLREGQGLLPKLMKDAAFRDEVTGEVEQILRRINTLAGKVTEGDGTVARLIDDPSVYEAINDIIVGIDESRLLRWLIRNRQKKGIEKRHETMQEESEAPPEATTPPPP